MRFGSTKHGACCTVRLRGWAAARRAHVPGISGLTIHSSRCRFAARLNSGVSHSDKTPKDLKLEELLQTIVEQNESILAVLERIADKLDVLDDIKYSMSSVEDELQWHKDLSTTAQIIKAVESVADAVRDQS